MYFSDFIQKESVPVVSGFETVPIQIVLKDDQDHLIPLTVQSDCTDEIACLNKALHLMSHSYGQLHAVLPQHVQVHSLVCEPACVVDFSKELLEFVPAEKSQIEQVLSVLLQKYENVEITVENQTIEAIQLHEYLKPFHLIEKDYTKGYLYQMYQTKELNNTRLLVPVMIFAKSADAVSVIENYYSMNVSVQFDNVNFQTVKIEEGDPYQLILSPECLKNHELLVQDILPVLHSLNQYTDAVEVEIVVSDVVVGKINLNELILNEIYLPD
jgi:hypothetical protein